MTLKQLIDNGLQVGALVELKEFPTYIAQWNGEIFVSVIDNGWHLVGDTVFDDDSDDWQPTTAYDSGIDPKTLPIEEPFWTGWFYDWNHGICKIEKVIKNTANVIIAIECNDGYYHGKLNCQPCLPPS